MRVKICGIQTLEEAMMCIKAGADAVGFLVGVTHKAEDKIAPHQAHDIIRDIPPFISKAMVTHLTDPREIIEIANITQADTIQLHEDMAVKDIVFIKAKLPFLKLIKAVHVVGKREECIARALQFEPYVDAILLDSRTKDRIGGTGVVHDWNISAEIRTAVKKPLMLAGGLKPENLAEAINMVNPFGVDVNSGVEDTCGKKDEKKVAAFIRIAKGQ